MMSGREIAYDAAGQVLRVGDLAGGVRVGQYPVTVVGEVTGLGKLQVKIRVLSDPAGRAGVHTGNEVWVYLNRAFRVAEMFLERNAT